ncbi:transposase [Salmonella enterica]|nr:transposase [Salmonella enterica subsp. enterica serovar Panama]EMD2987226.1 transposase [Salmonella enterica]EMD3059826.1 transposase [Salmonella enterica]EMD3064393.1 transposase [Salmonella enterica]EMD3096325.1 transposase [Salmonella enterica]
MSDIQKNASPGRPKGCLNYPPELKQRLIEASFQPGVSISRLALDNGINANLLFKWRQGKIKLLSSESGRESQLIPVTIDAELPTAPATEPLTAIPSVTPEIHNISCEITFRNGTLRLNGTVNENLLSLLIQELRR